MNFKLLIRTGAVAASALALSGCLKGTGLEGTLAEVVHDSINGIADLEQEDQTVPTSGSANYSGSAIIDMAPESFADERYVLAGEATLKANFSAAGGSLSGSLQNFVGAEAVNMTEFSDALYAGAVEDLEAQFEAFTAVDGTIEISPDGNANGNPVVAFDGTLTHEGNTIEVGGTGSGHFIGTDAAGVKIYGGTGLSVNGDMATLDINGAPQKGMVYVNALQD